MTTGVIPKQVEWLCGHCRCVCATATGDWDDGALGELLILCGDCAHCDKSPPSRSLLDVIMNGGLH